MAEAKKLEYDPIGTRCAPVLALDGFEFDASI
jgi:hypothetical protein